MRYKKHPYYYYMAKKEELCTKNQPNLVKLGRNLTADLVENSAPGTLPTSVTAVVELRLRTRH